MLNELQGLLKKPLNLLPWRIPRKLATFAVVCMLGLGVAGIFQKYSSLPVLQIRVLALTVIAIGLWLTEAIPAFAVSLLIVATQVFVIDHGNGRGSELSFVQYTQAWSSPVLWLILGGFVLSLGLSITGLDRLLAHTLLNLSRGRSKILIATLLALAGLLSMFMSNTATTALLVSIVLPLLKQPHAKVAFNRASLLSIATGATIGGMGTIIGSSPNAIALAYFSGRGLKVSFLDWMQVGLPLVLLILIPVYFFLVLDSDIPSRISEELPSVQSNPDSGLAAEDQKRMNLQRVIVVLTFGFTTILWMTSPLHSWSVSAVAFVPLVLFTVTGIIRDQHIRQLPWDTLLFVMGGLVLGDAVSDSGLASTIVNLLPLSQLPTWQILLGLGYLTMLLSNVLSNTATAALLIPIAAKLAPSAEVPAVLVVALAASSSLLLPISTPTNAVVYSTGLLSQRDFRRVGILVGLLAPGLICLVCNKWGFF